MDEPIFQPPPYFAQEAVVALSETVDWSLAKNKIPELQLAGYDGTGILVGVVDTGVNANHPDLAGAIADVRDFTGEGIEDRVGHGTHVAGIIAAQANHIGTRGVAHRARLLIAKALTNAGGSDGAIANAILWLCAQGAKIINLSLGSPVEGPQMMAATLHAASSGVLVIAAAGNDGQRAARREELSAAIAQGKSPEEIQAFLRSLVNYPAKYPHVLAVAAYDEEFLLAPFSSTGREVATCCPGVNILSTYKSGQYARLSGTSMAAPFAAGVAALLRQKHPDITTIDKLVAAFKRGAIDKGAPGLDDEYGWGILNPWDVLVDPEPPPVQPPPPPPAGPSRPPVKRPLLEIDLGIGLVFHVPALPTDLASGGIGIKAGAALAPQLDGLSILKQLEAAALAPIGDDCD